MKKLSARPESVFLNLPFEKAYEEVFVGLIVALVTLGLAPRCVLEVEENGDGRLARLYRLIATCRISFHDLSYRGAERRYNMPFELGIAFALTRKKPGRVLYIFESEPHDLLKVLTDCRSFDPKRHNGKGELAMDAVYESFSSPQRQDSEDMGRAIYPAILKKLPVIRRGRDDVFNRRSFLLLVFEVSVMYEVFT